MNENTVTLDISDGVKVEYIPPTEEEVGGDNLIRGVMYTIFSDYDYHFEAVFNVRGNPNIGTIPIMVSNYEDLLIEIESYIEEFIAPTINKHLISSEHPEGHVGPYLLNAYFRHNKIMVRHIRVVKSKEDKINVEESKTTIDPEDLADLIRQLGYAVVLASPKRLNGEKSKDFEKKIKQRYRL